MRADGSDDRPNVYLEDGQAVYRASAIGGCFRALVAGRLGMEERAAPERFEKYYADGNRGEPVIVDWLNRQGWDMHSMQAEVELPIGECRVRGHIDGRGKAPDNSRRVVEIKTMSPGMFEKWESKRFEAFPRYAMQLATYMAVFDEMGVMVIGVKDSDGNVSDDRIHTFPVNELPVALAQIKVRLAKVEASAKRVEADPTLDLPACDLNMYPCPFYHLHDEKEESGAQVVEDETVAAELRKWASAYDEARTAETRAKEKKEHARGRILAECTKLGLERVRAGDFEVGVTTRLDRKVDMAKLRAAMPNLAQFEEEKPVTTVTVKEAK